MKQVKNDKIMTTNDISDCPHCGATYKSLDKINGKGVYAYMDAPGKSITATMHVACLECGSGSPSLKVWNRRYPDSGKGVK